MRWAELWIDLLSVAPLLVWMVVAVAAIPTYARIGWFAPVACASFTFIICLYGSIMLWRRTHYLRRRVVYLVIGSEIATTPPTKLGNRIQIFIAGSAVSISLVWAILDIVANAQFRSRTALMPCDGKCAECVVDPHCQAWADGVRAAHPLTNVCPPPQNPSGTTDSTFSCAADMGWMFVTAAISCVWLITVACRHQPVVEPVVSPFSQRPTSGLQSSPTTV